MKQSKKYHNRFSRKAFTLIELLVVIAIIALLLSILMPALGRAKELGRAVVCRSNIRSLVLGNIAYASEYNDRMVLAASDINTTNLNRWHGVRTTTNEVFDYQRSALLSYIGNGDVKQCLQNVKFRHGNPAAFGFEDGCGGYGYSMTYLGSRIWAEGFSACGKATKLTEVRSPSQKLMFADTAMGRTDAGVVYFAEYSFAEAPFFLSNGKPQPAWGYASPSIHFRHNEQANVGWVDGHIGAEKMTEFSGVNAYGVLSSEMMLGWFGALNNAVFQVK